MSYARREVLGHVVTIDRTTKKRSEQYTVYVDGHYLGTAKTYSMACRLADIKCGGLGEKVSPEDRP